MDPVRNPYAPGAGTPPPELAGRDELRELVRVAIARVRRGSPAKSILMVGLRGVGKTVLLDRMRDDAEVAGIRPCPETGGTHDTHETVRSLTRIDTWGWSSPRAALSILS